MELKGDDTSVTENENFAPEYRDRLRTWLVKMINSGTIPGLCWENDEQTVFRMPWKHAGRQDYNLEEDSKIFMAWAKHSGRYREGIDKPEPIVWKTRLRCALNKMPDIRELPDRSRLDISEPYRVYQLLPPVHKASQIRRRFYKRSQSQDVDHVRTYGGDQSASMITSPSSEADNWNKLAGSRRNSSSEAIHFNLPGNRTSPPSSRAISSLSPTYNWFNAAATPLTAPMSGLPLPQTSAMTADAVNQLHSLTQVRYPLIPSLTNPFVTFTPNSLFSSSAPTLATFKHFMDPTSMADKIMSHTTAMEQKYNGHIRTLSGDDTDSEKAATRTHERRTCQRQASQENATSTSLEHLRKNALKLQPQARDSASDLSVGDSVYVEKMHELYARLTEARKRIEELESALKESRKAHAQERKSRMSLEAEMKLVLEHMGDRLRSLAIRINPRNGTTLKEFTSNCLYSTDKKNRDVSRMLDLDKENDDSRADSPRSASLENPPSPFVAIAPSPVKMEARTPVNRDRKRPASPLDLTVHSPTKLPRPSSGDNDVSWRCTSNSPPIPFVPSFMASSSVRSSPCDDKQTMISPYSASSDSPDVALRQHGTSTMRSRSLSPYRSPPIMLHQIPQGTIRVT